MKFIDNEKSNNPKKLNIIALIFVLIALAGVFLNLNNDKQKLDKIEKVETLKKIASDTTLKNINIKYKTADSGEFTSNSKLTQTSEYTKKFHQTMITVAILFVVFLLVIYLLKKKNNFNFGTNDNIKIIDKKFLGQKQFLVTIIVENEKLLLGITDQSINLIKTFKLNSKEKQKDENENVDKNKDSFPKVLGKIRNDSNSN